MDNKFRLVEFIKYEDEFKISINPTHIVSIEQWDFKPEDDVYCHVYLVGRANSIRIKATYAEVKERCLS